MHNVKSLIKKLAILTPLLLHTITSAGDGTTTIQNIPPEVLAISLRKLLEKGDYEDFLSAELANKATFQRAIQSDPVLKGTIATLQTIREPMEIILNTNEDLKKRTEALESVMKEIIDSAKKESGGEPAMQSQIINNVGFPVFRSIKEVIDKPTNQAPGMPLLCSIAKFIPIDYMGQLENLRDYLSQLYPLNTSQKAFILFMLAKNPNVPSDVVLKKIEALMELLEHLSAKNSIISKAFLTLALRPELGKETVEYFKSKEGDPLWQQTPELQEVLEKFRSNPASKQ